MIKGLSLNFGATQRRSVRDLSTIGILNQNAPASAYGANAQHFGLDYAAGSRLVLHASVTQLREDSGLLGVQSLQAGALQNGSTTRATSFGADVNITPTLSLSASGTLANTVAAAGQGLRTAPGGLTSTAAEIALTKASVFDRADRLRLTLSKPMQVTSGSLQYAGLGVVDRQTGEIGQVVQTAGAANGRTPFAAELFYGRLLNHQAAEASVFVRAGVNTDQFTSDARNDYMVGYRYKLAF